MSGRVDKDSNVENAEISGPKDVLYFMRHKPSHTEIHQVMICVTLLCKYISFNRV